MADLKKLLVIVKGQENYNSFKAKYIDGSPRETDYDNKVVFLEYTQEIFTQGKLYGGGADIAALKAILAGYGEGQRATTVAGDIDAMLAKIGATNIMSVAYNASTGEYVSESHLGLTTNATTYALELTGYNGKLGTSVDVASNNSAFVEANNAYLTNVKGVTEYVTAQIGQLSGGMRYNGNVVTKPITEGSSTYIGYFPWNSATSSMKPGDTAIADKDFVVYNVAGTQIVKNIEAGDILIGKYGTEIKKEDWPGYDDGIILNEETLAYVTIIERETDTMVTASNVFDNADRVILSNTNGRDVKASAMIVGADTNTYFTTANTLATEVAVANYVNTKINGLDVEAYELKNAYMSFSYAEADGLVTVNGLNTYITSVTYAAGSLTVGTDNGLLDKNAADAINSYIKYIGNKIDNFNETITTVSAYVDPTGTYYLTVTDNKTDNDHNYVINAYIKQLGSAVGMTYDATTGKWIAADGSITYDGLVSAYDVAKEITDDEKVIAAALNDHETRIKACETYKPADGDAEGASNGITTYAYTVAGTIKGITVTTANAVLTYTDGNITVANASYFMNGDGDLNAIKAYAVAQGDAAKAAAQSAITSAIEGLDATITYNDTTNGIGITIVETDGKLTSVETYWSAANAVAYISGAYTYTVTDVAAAVYDPWETFTA